MRSTKIVGLSFAVAGVTTLILASNAQAVPFDVAHNTPCENAASISGVGSSFQRNAQLSWGAKILAPAPGAPLAQGFGYDTTCTQFKLPPPATNKQVQYAPTGSGAGRTAVGATPAPNSPRNLTIQFAASDEAPSQVEINNANAGGPAATDNGKLHTIPNAQGAITVALRIPDNCQIGAAAARQLSRVAVEGAFRASATSDQWGELFGTAIRATSGGAPADAVCQSKKFKRVVRSDNSGTTFQFKRYLQKASPSTPWSEPGLPNTSWPNNSGANAVVVGAANGNGPLLDALSAQRVNGGIGYSDLGTARSKGYGWDFTGATPAPADRTIWVRVQGIGHSAFVSPATNDNQLAGPAQKGANCASVTYAGVPASTLVSWLNADATATPVGYPVCTLTYELTFQSLAAIGVTSDPQGKGRGRKDYLGYHVGAPGLGTAGQAKLPLNDYGTLPAPIRTKALAGVASLEA